MQLFDPTAPSPTQNHKLAPRLTSLQNMRIGLLCNCLLYTSPSPRDVEESRMPSSA